MYQYMSRQDQCSTNAIQKPGGNMNKQKINENKRRQNLLHEVFFPGQDVKLLH